MRVGMGELTADQYTEAYERFAAFAKANRQANERSALSSACRRVRNSREAIKRKNGV